MIPVFVGYDPREAVCYHTFCESVISRSSEPVSFVPLAQNLLGFNGKRDGSNDFIYSRFLVPYLSDFKGWAIYADGDMVCLTDIAELWGMRHRTYFAVQVVKHDYKTKHPTKYLGSRNEDYPRKNWSSLILWNCAHYGNRGLTPELVSKASGEYLHRFAWLDDDRIGSLPAEWNHLELEQQTEEPKLVHFTIGAPCFPEYANTPNAGEWHRVRQESQRPCVV